MLCSPSRIRSGSSVAPPVRAKSHVYQSSSFVGPLVVGLIADLTGNIRYGFFFVVFMIWLAIPLLLGVDVERGRDDAESYSYRTSEP